MRFRPTVAVERMIAAAKRVGENPVTVARELEWRTTSTFPRLALFALTAVGIYASFGIVILFDILEQEPAQLFIGLFSIAAGELLIDRRRFFRHGVEEALWSIGAVMIVTSPGGDSVPAGLAAIGVALAVSAIRLLNPWIGLASVAFLGASLSDWIDDTAVGWVALILAILFAIIDTFEQKRPFHARFVELSTILCYGFAAAILSSKGVAGLTAAVIGGITLAAIGLRRRILAPILAVLAGGGFVLYEISGYLDWKPEAEAFAWGLVLLTSAVLWSRRFAGKTEGITSDRLRRATDEEIAQTVLIAAATPGTSPESAPAREGEGDFGGGGATDRW
ncbi:MAG: hypothetical protein KY459_01545 [Acidobacteria bacterium]|nr:hypothetical protein [Acidobacteriota bacterium]